MQWYLKQYKDAYDDFVVGLDSDLVTQIEARMATLLLKGNQTPYPVSEALGEGLFELRARYKTVRARVLYGFLPGRIIVVVFCALKARRKLSPGDLRAARTLLAEAQRFHGALNVPQQYPSKPH